MPEPFEIRFPPPRPGSNLALPRRRPVREAGALFEASDAARESIRAIVRGSQVPFDPPGVATSHRIAELEGALRHLELRLSDRERVVDENEARLAARERELAEEAALLDARAKLVEASRRRSPVPVSPEERAALAQLRTELERQEASIAEARAAIRERERFLDESEEQLMSKVQEQQEKEIELDQREEDLAAREGRLLGREAKFDPGAAAALEATLASASVRDEFRE